MDNIQTAALLTLASGADRIRRTPDEVKLWALALEQVTFDDARQALVAHLADPEVGTDFLKPAHITRQLAKRRSAAVLRPIEARMCDLHDGYPISRTGRCDQCTRYPEDRLTGTRPTTRHFSELALTVGRTIPQEH